MIQRSRRVFLHGSALLTSLALAMARAGAQEQEARLVKDGNRQISSYGSYLGWMKPLRKGVVFAMETIEHGYELWTSNGTPGGTRLLKEGVPGPGGWTPYNPVPFGEGASAKVAFQTNYSGYGDEIWVTDGTEAGTLCVFQPRTRGPSHGANLAAGTPAGVFFHGSDREESGSTELFFSDGTAAGTHSLNPPVEGSPRRFSSPYLYFVDGRWGYFTAKGNEIWRSDGTDAGTTKLVTVPLEPGEQRYPLAVAGGRLFFSGYEGEHGYSELWTCPVEGGAMTRVGPQENSYPWEISAITTLGDRLVFAVGDEERRQHLWTSDGTEAGTREIPLPESEGDAWLYDFAFVHWHGAIYFTFNVWNEETLTYAEVLYRTDGTEAGTTRVASFPHGAYLFPEAEWREAEDFLYFQAQTAEGQWDLWRTKGTAASTRPAKGIPATHYLRAIDDNVAATESGIFFSAAGGPGSSGMALWRQRGKTDRALRLTRPGKTTESGLGNFFEEYLYGILPFEATQYEMTGGLLVAFIKTGDDYELWRMSPDGSRARAIWKPSMPLQENGALAFRGTTASGAIFSYSDGANVRQVWVTDGTRPGTKLLADHGAAADDTYPYDFVNVDGVWFYSALSYSSTPGSLWKTDGTRAGTSKVVATDGSSPYVNAYNLVAFQGSAWFPAAGANGKIGLWRSDGTPAGTVMVKDTWHGQAGERPVGLSVVGGKLVFSVQLANSQVLWQSDGTTAGTVALSSNNFFQRWGVDRAADVGGVAIFPAAKAPFYIERVDEQLWCYDNANGLRPLQNPSPGDLSFVLYPWEQKHAVAGTRMFYSGGANLWVTDGTSAGTREIPAQGSSYSYPRHLLAVGDMVYFSANDEAHGRELWRSDGTEAGTVLVADINPGQADSDPQGLKVMDGKLYFHANRRDVGRELFVIDLPVPEE